MQSFDIRQLRYAIAAIDHGSFHRAARAMEIEESTLSRNVQRLERVISVKLFIRSRSGVTATVAGESFLRDARRMVEQAERMLSQARATGKGRAGGLMFGHHSPISAGNLRSILFAWRDANPDVAVDGIEDGHQALIAGLDSGIIDLAIMTGEIAYPGVRRASLWSERVLVALPDTHELAARDHVLWFDLKHETFLLPTSDPGPEWQDLLLRRLSGPGFRPNIKTHAVSRESLMSVLGGGLGMTITCESALGAHYPQVVMKEIHDFQGQTLIGYSGYWRTDNENPALKRFLAFARSRYSLIFDS